MYSIAIVLALSLTSDAAHASWIKWIGDRTGLRRGICEAFGECERRRTERRREEAARAEDELADTRENLAAERKVLTEAERQLGGVRGELAKARADIATKIHNIAGRLNQVTVLNAASRDAFDDLLAEHKLFATQVGLLAAELKRVDGSTPKLLAGFSREGQNELKQALVAYGQEKSVLANQSAKLIQRRGRRGQELLQITLEDARSAYRKFNTVAVGEHAERGRKALEVLREDIDQILRLMREAQGSVGGQR